jgi:hypothetical protein
MAWLAEGRTAAATPAARAIEKLRLDIFKSPEIDCDVTPTLMHKTDKRKE